MKRFLSALLVSCLTLSSMPAALVWTDADFSIPQTLNGLYLNPYTGLTATSQPADYNTAPWLNPFFGGTFFANSPLALPVIIGVGVDQIANLGPGTLIGPASTFAAGEIGSATHMGPAANQFQPGVPGFIGFSFQPSVGGSTYYGWASVTFDNVGGGTIHSFAYEDTGGSILTPVPEPSFGVSLALGVAFALGLAELRVRRRRQGRLGGTVPA